MKMETGAQRRPTQVLSVSSSSPVTSARVVTGMPIEPKATGAVFASRHMPAAKNGEKPRPVIMAAATATGVPNPAAPSMNAPSAKAISMACSRRSVVMPPIESLIISNCPVSTVSRYRTTAQNTIQPIGNQPKAAPSAVELMAVGAGMP
jgi:hypothetical protein